MAIKRVLKRWQSKQKEQAMRHKFKLLKEINLEPDHNPLKYPARKLLLSFRPTGCYTVSINNCIISNHDTVFEALTAYDRKHQREIWAMEAKA
jgi:hypothetical protein